MTDSTEPTTETPKRKPGRPKGSRTRGGNVAALQRAATEPPPAPNDPLGAALFPPAGTEPTAPPTDEPKAKGGRPRATDVKDAELRRATAAAYRRLASMLSLASLPAGLLLGPATAGRFGAVAEALDAGADDCAAALVEWSRTNPRIRKMLDNLGNGSGAIAVIAAHAPIMHALVRVPAGAENSTAGAGSLDLLALSDLLFAGAAASTPPAPVAADAP